MAFDWGGVVGGAIGAIGNLFGGKSSADAASDVAARNETMQREFAQNGIRWKVADAQAAGIHPLYALGAQTASFTPSTYVGGDSGADYSAAGQDIGRAIHAATTKPEKYSEILARLQVENGEAQNELLRAQTRAIIHGTGPSMPTNLPSALPGQGDVPGTDIQPVSIDASISGRPEVAAGIRADSEYVNIGENRISPNPAKGTYGEDQDLTNPGIIGWYLRNSLMPRISRDAENRNRPPDSYLPDWANDWKYNPWSNSYEPIKNPRKAFIRFPPKN